jgi:hypothetical protein
MAQATSNGDAPEVAHISASASDQQLDAAAVTAAERHSDGGDAEQQSLGRASRRSSAHEQDSEQARADADLEASVLDTLTDSVLTGPPLFCSTLMAHSRTP